MARDAEAELRASEQAKPIPTLSMLGLFILSGLLGLFGIWRLAIRMVPEAGLEPARF